MESCPAGSQPGQVARSKSTSPTHRFLSSSIVTTHLINLAVSTCKTKHRLQANVDVTDLWWRRWLKAPEKEKCSTFTHATSCCRRRSFLVGNDWKNKTVVLRKYTGSYISTTVTSFKCAQMTVLLSWLYVTLIWAIILEESETNMSQWGRNKSQTLPPTRLCCLINDQHRRLMATHQTAHLGG